ncbi:major facilitator superfamily domain-containing protein [Baffinella frigidus]|nr:major facilitator superfamily domain-containing protein [Cryptophyta sp. CCMP2293]
MAPLAMVSVVSPAERAERDQLPLLDSEEEAAGEAFRRGAVNQGEARKGDAGGGDAGSGNMGAVHHSEDREGSGGCCRIHLSPKVLLAVFIYANLLNYIDRGLVMGALPEFCVNCVDEHIFSDCAAQRSCLWTNVTLGTVGSAAGNGSDGDCTFDPEVAPNMGIGGSMGVNQTAQGVLAGAFMGGYCVFSPIFAYLASTDISPFSIVGTGLSVWPPPAMLGSPPPHYNVRHEPARRYAVGGFLCADLDADRLGFAGWRAAFFLEAVAMAPVVLLCGFVTNRLKKHTGAEEEEKPAIGGGTTREEASAEDSTSNPESAADEASPPAWARRGAGREAERGGEGKERQGVMTAWETVWVVVKEPVWVCAVLGYGAFTFSIGAAAVWGPSFLQRVYHMRLQDADLVFGGLAVVTGLAGTMLGGVALDLTTRLMGGDVMSAALLSATVLCFMCWPLTLLAFWVEDWSWFLLLMGVGQILAFATLTPVNGVLLWAVPPAARSISIALAVVGMHLIGDVPSPIVVGALFETSLSPNIVMVLVMTWIGWAVFFWGLAFCLTRRRLFIQTQYAVAQARHKYWVDGTDSPLLHS